VDALLSMHYLLLVGGSEATYTVGTCLMYEDTCDGGGSCLCGVTAAVSIAMILEALVEHADGQLRQLCSLVWGKVGTKKGLPVAYGVLGLTTEDGSHHALTHALHIPIQSLYDSVVVIPRLLFSHTHQTYGFDQTALQSEHIPRVHRWILHQRGLCQLV